LAKVMLVGAESTGRKSSFPARWAITLQVLPATVAFTPRGDREFRVQPVELGSRVQVTVASGVEPPVVVSTRVVPRVPEVDVTTSGACAARPSVTVAWARASW
jgi:hypothetical protein